MADTMDKSLDKLLAAVDAALGPAYSALLYGSAARGNWTPGRSDINVLLVAPAVGPAELRQLGPAFTAWRKASHEPPLLLSAAEWVASADSFPLEITDMRSAYRVLRGDDPLALVTVRREDLRRALEHEMRGKLIRLRQGYVVLAADAERLSALATASLSTILLLFRSLLALLGRAIPPDSLQLAAAVGALVGFQGEQVEYVVRHREERRRRCSAAQFEDYLEAVERTARYVDQLQLGDQ